MSIAQPQAAIREELRQVEEDEDLARLRETAADLRRRIGERAGYPTDPAELSAEPRQPGGPENPYSCATGRARPRHR